MHRKQHCSYFGACPLSPSFLSCVSPILLGFSVPNIICQCPLPQEVVIFQTPHGILSSSLQLGFLISLHLQPRRNKSHFHQNEYFFFPTNPHTCPLKTSFIPVFHTDPRGQRQVDPYFLDGLKFFNDCLALSLQSYIKE